MKKALIIILLILIAYFATFFFGKKETTAQQWGALTLRHGYRMTSGTFVLDGAGANTTKKFAITTGREQLAFWGSATVWLKLDTLKADISSQDSFKISYKELKEDANLVIRKIEEIVKRGRYR